MAINDNNGPADLNLIAEHHRTRGMASENRARREMVEEIFAEGQGDRDRLAAERSQNRASYGFNEPRPNTALASVPDPIEPARERTVAVADAAKPLDAKKQDHGDKALAAATGANLKKQAEFYASGEYAWASDFFDPKPAADREKDLTKRDMAGADQMAGLRGASLDQLQEKLDKGLATLRTNADATLAKTTAEMGKEKGADVGDAAAHTAAQEAVESVKVAEEAVKAAEANYSQGVANAAQYTQKVLENQREDDANTLNEIDARFTSGKEALEKAALQRMGGSIEGHPNTPGLESHDDAYRQTQEFKDKLAADPEYQAQLAKLESEHTQERAATLQAQSEGYIKLQENLAEEQKKEELRLQVQYREDLYSALGSVAKATEDVGIAQTREELSRAQEAVIKAEENLANARAGRGSAVDSAEKDLEAAKAHASGLREDLDDRLAVRGANKDNTFNRESMEDASRFRAQVEEGQKARAALQSKKIDDFIDFAKNDIDKYYAGEITKLNDEKSGLVGDKRKEAEAKLVAEKDKLIGKLDDIKTDRGLLAQMDVVNARVDKIPDLSDEERQQMRMDMFKAAMKYKEEGRDSKEFARNYLAETSNDVLKTIKPVKLSDHGVSESEVLQISIRENEVEILMRGNKEKITLTGAAAKNIIENGLDLSGTSRSHDVHLHVDASTGVGVDGKELLLHGTNGHRIKLGVTGTTELGGSWDRDPATRSMAYAGVKSAGGNNLSGVDDNAGQKSVIAAIAAAKKDFKETQSLAAQFDLDGDKQVSGAEVDAVVAKLDRDGDGKLTRNEMPPNVLKALAALNKDNADVMLAMKDMNAGKDYQITNIANLGNFQPQALASNGANTGKTSGRA